jgi:hypothetical protein
MLRRSVAFLDSVGELLQTAPIAAKKDSAPAYSFTLIFFFISIGKRLSQSCPLAGMDRLFPSNVAGVLSLPYNCLDKAFILPNRHYTAARDFRVDFSTRNFRLYAGKWKSGHFKPLSEKRRIGSW